MAAAAAAPTVCGGIGRRRETVAKRIPVRKPNEAASLVEGNKRRVTRQCPRVFRPPLLFFFCTANTTRYIHGGNDSIYIVLFFFFHYSNIFVQTRAVHHRQCGNFDCRLVVFIVCKSGLLSIAKYLLKTL